MATLKLTGSVGSGRSKRGVPHNQAADVTKVRDRLVALGFTWVRGATRGTEPLFLRTIKLFQSICKGQARADKGDGRVDLRGATHRWLAAVNAPVWTHVYGMQGLGWYNTSDYTDGNGGYCTNWLLNRLIVAGVHYFINDVIMNIDPAQGGVHFPPMWVRECSPERGGRARGHASHQTGIDVDMRLPLRYPDTADWTFLGTRGYTDPRYHRDAARAQLRAIKSHMNTKLVLFNDPQLIRLGLCTRYANHQHHYHIRINPPTRVEGDYR